MCMTTQRKKRQECTCRNCPACNGTAVVKTDQDWVIADFCRACEATGLADLNCPQHFPYNAAVADVDKAWGEFREAIYAALIPGIYRVFIALDDFRAWRAHRRVQRYLKPSLSVRLARRFPRLFNPNGDLF